MLLLRVAILIVALHDAEALRPASRPQLSKHQPSSKRSVVVAAAAATSGEAGLPSSTANLVKSIVGSGVLSLPVGLAAFSSSRAALGPSLALLTLAGTVSGYCFLMVARVCAATGSNSWGEAWSKSVGERSSWVPPALIGLLCFSVSVQYTMVIGDSFSSIFSAVGMKGALASRSGSILLLTLLGTLPLSMLPSLSMLGFTSILGVAGLLYTAAFMIARIHAYVPGSALHAAVPAALQPRFDSVLSFSPKIFVLVSILASAFLCHFVAPQFFNELSPGTPAKPEDAPNQKMRRFSILTAAGFGLSAVLTAVVMVAGFLTFGGACDGFILNNYAPTDKLAQLARIAIGSQIVFTYPFIHVGLRDSTQDVLRAVLGKAPPRIPTTLGIFAVTTCLALRLTNLGMIAAVTGALVSTSIGYILPSIMFGQTLARTVQRGGASFATQCELFLSRAITGLGVVLAAIGALAAVGVL